MSELERWIGACIVPELRVPGTLPGHAGCAPDAAYLERFPPVGVIVFGRTPEGPGHPEPLLEALREACERAGGPTPFACCDLEQGAGHHFASATRLPPALALGAAAERDERGLELVRAAGELCAREARERGIDLVLAPVCDLDSNPDNPIIAVRSFGPDPARVAACAAAFLRGLHAGGAGGCAKHWPGHGDTSVDSHLDLPRIEHDLDRLRRVELAPFRSLAREPLDAVMAAHLDVPALTGEPGLPVSLSAAALRQLREQGGFAGPVLSDGIDMGALARFPDRHARALAAGCDGLLCPTDPMAAALGVLRAVEEGRLEPARLEAAAQVMESLRLDLRARRAGPAQRAQAELAGLPSGTDLARACLWSPDPGAWRRGNPAWRAEAAFPGHGSPEARAAVAHLMGALPGEAAGPLALVVTAESLAGRREAGLDADRRAQLAQRLAELEAAGRPTGLIWLAPPGTLPAAWARGSSPALLVGFAPTPPMAAAAAVWLAERGPAGSRAERSG